MKNKTIEIPVEVWPDLVNILYTAVQHITPTKENEEAISFLKQTIYQSFQDEEILIVDGKIISKDSLND